MKKINWIFVGLVLLLSINSVTACDLYYSTTDDGWGTFSGDLGSGCGSVLHYQTSGDPYYAYITFHVPESCSSGSDIRYITGTDSDTACNNFHNPSPDWIGCGQSSYATVSGTGGCVGAGAYNGGIVQVTLTVSPTGLNQYKISGYAECVDYVDLYIKNSTDKYIIVERNNTGTSYSFNILQNSEYKLIFSNGYEHEFTCTKNIIYNYDGCGQCTINIYDECANLLHNQFTWIDDSGNIVYEGRDNPIIIPSSKVNKDDKLTVMWTTWLGALQKTCYAQFDHDINLYDPFIYWDMKVYVYDNESNPISGANVDFNQDCIISGYPTRNKFTGSDGVASFTQCENDNANLIVSKDEYKTLSTSISGGWYDVYTPTYQVSVVLQSSDSDNSSTWDLINDSINDTNATEIPTDIPDANDTPNDIQLYFRNIEGYRITEVNDTDDYVRCYYSVWCDDPVSMTLKFQESSNGYDWSDAYTYGYNPDNDSYGYMNVSNSYFNDSTLMYRAYIYDVSYPYNDRYAYLNVVNVTNESETHYENLTGYCMFMHTNKNGSIDYREDIICYAMVISDNASLRMVSLELYDNSTLIDYTNLTNSSFDDDIYGWYLGYNYTLGHNYSLVLRGYDGSILDCDNVIAYNLIGNKLTIKVTDSFNHPLSNVYVFCEHYGSINTGYLNYGTFEGLPNGETRYKASKSGYRSGLWSTVNLTDENEIVSYQLIQEKQEGSTAMVRLSDDDAKNLYYPLMYFLLTLILLGALINVIK